MPAFCCVVNCGSRGERDPVKFYRIPAELNYKHKKTHNELSKLRRQKWSNAIKRADLTESKLKYAVVCSKHFISGKPASLTDQLNPDWIPSLNMGYKPGNILPSNSKVARYERRKKKQLVELVQVPLSEELTEQSTVGSDEIQQVDPNLKSTQTKLNMEDLTQMFIDLAISKERILQMQNLLLCCKNLENTIQTKYYTGLVTYKVFQVVLIYLTPFIKVHGNTSLKAEEQVLLTLVKLRLNPDFKDLAYRFGISAFTASTYFKNILHIMYLRMKNFVFWPDRSVLCKTMPQCFKDSFQEKTTVIIDCFEIQFERPSSLLTAAES